MQVTKQIFKVLNIESSILVKCFLKGFLYNKVIYFHEMANIPVGERISPDYSFKIASNIDYTRED